jgi:diguanylate cyclase (GGDEF)-like protein/PAS domain S-box-containing protein
MADPQSIPHRTDDELKMVKAILSTLATEVVVLVTPQGEVITTNAHSLVIEASEIEAFVHPEDLVAALAFLRRVSRGLVQPSPVGLRVDEISLSSAEPVIDLDADFGAEVPFPDFDAPSYDAPFVSERLRFRIRRPDERWEPVEAEVVDPKNHPLLSGVVMRVRPLFDGGVDHTDAHERFQSLAELLPCGILSADRRGEVGYCNVRAETILSRGQSSLLGRGWEQSVHAGDIAMVQEAASLAAREGIPQQVVFRVETGLFQRWAAASFVPLGVPPAHTGWIATLEDVTDRLRAESQLSHRATHDALTGLPNRTLFEDRLRQACARLRRGTRSVTVVFVDLDSFKDINDRHGHAAGDAVLINVGRRIQDVVRDVDTVCRYAGDEFVVLCEDLDDGAVDGLEGRIAAAISEPMVLASGPVQTGASVGAVTTSEPAVEVADLLAEADAAMYRDKRANR